MRKKEGARKREPDGRIDAGGNSQSDQEIYESRIRREEIESERNKRRIMLEAEGEIDIIAASFPSLQSAFAQIVFALAISAYLFLSNKAPPFE